MIHNQSFYLISFVIPQEIEGLCLDIFLYDWSRGRHRRPWDTPSDLANKDLLYSVRSLQSYKFNLIFIFLIPFTKFSSTIVYRLYDRKVPNTLTCSFVLSNSSILERMCFIVRNQIALLFFLFHFKPETFSNQLKNWRCNLRASTLLGFIVYVYLQIEKLLLVDHLVTVCLNSFGLGVS